MFRSLIASLGQGVAAWLGSPTAAHLSDITTDKTGTGALVFATSPTLITPILGVATATSINKIALTAPSTSATLTIADGKTLTASNTLIFAGTDGATLNISSSTSVGRGQYLGTNTSDNASAGNIGEYISASLVSSSATAIAPNTTINVTSIPLTAGDWEIWGTVTYTANATPVAPITTVAGIISASSNGLPAGPIGLNTCINSLTTNGIISVTMSSRLSLAANSSAYLNAYANYVGASGVTAYGGIEARRPR